MSNHILHALQQWFPVRHDANWILGAVIHTEGSVYRKTGALMLLSDTGHQLGMLSGGCLEADLQLQALKVIQSGAGKRIIYDANDEGGLAWRLGIGCGGLAEIVLHPCMPSNNFLLLDKLKSALESQRACQYRLNVDRPMADLSEGEKDFRKRVPGERMTTDTGDHLVIHVNPPPHLLIMGGGVDMQPLSSIASELGWKVTVVDKRPTNSREANFPRANAVLAKRAPELGDSLLQTIDAAIIANHNMNMDAEALAALQHSSALYIGLLGPDKRKQNVLALAKLSENNLRKPVAGPMGLALGGDLPESIALSVLAECHAVVYGSNALPLNHAYL